MAGLIVLLVAVAARADDEPKVRVTFGFGKMQRADCWTPIMVEVPQGYAGDFDGQAVILPSGSGGAEPGRFSVPVQLTSAEGGAAGGYDRFWLYVRPGSRPFSGAAHLATKGGSFKKELFPASELTGGMLPESKTVIVEAGMPSLGIQDKVVGLTVNLSKAPAAPETVMPYAEHYEALRADVRSLPDRAIGYEGIDVLVLIDPRVDTDLSAAQVEAMDGFVRGGGRLLILLSRPGQVPAEHPLTDLLPARPDRLVGARDLQPLQRMVTPITVQRKDQPPFAAPTPAAPQGEATVLVLDPQPGSRVICRLNEGPVVVERPLGMGSVCLAGLDLRSPAVRSWEGLPLFMASLLRMVSEPGSDLDVPCGRRAEDWLAVTSGGSAAFFWAIVLLTIVYMIVSGPVLYRLLKARGRRGLAWPLYMAISLAAAVACFGIVSVVRNRKVEARGLTLADFPADGSPAAGRTLCNLRFPDSSLYDLRLAAPSGYVAKASSTSLSRKFLGSGRQQFDYDLAPGPAGGPSISIRGLAVKSNQYRDFTARWQAPLPPPVEVVGLRRDGQGFAGTLRPTCNIRGMALITAEAGCLLKGGLDSGRTIDLRPGVSAETAAMFLKELAAELLDSHGGMLTYPGGPSSPAQGDGPAADMEVLSDAILASCYTVYRRHPVGPPKLQFGNESQATLSRTAWARPLDLSHLLDLGYGLLIGLAEIDLPDDVTINGRRPDERRRLVIFRQVVTLEPPAP